MLALLAHPLAPYATLSLFIVVMLVAVGAVRERNIAFGVTLVALGFLLVVNVPAVLGTGSTDVGELLRVDGYAIFFMALFAGAGIVTTLLSGPYVTRLSPWPDEYYILLTTAVLGAVVTAAANHFVSFLLGIEVLSISLYAMIAYPREGRKPLEAAAKYLVLSGAASSTMLFGMALIYMASGSLAFESMAGLSANDSLIADIGIAMLLVGILFKLSLAPFHMWTPDVYQGAPAPVTAFLATVSKGAVFAAFLRYATDAGILASDAIALGIAAVAVLSMVAGNVLALLQESVKRILAYSSIAHVGYLLIALIAAAGIGGNAALGVETTLVYLTGYFVMTLAAFGVMTALSSDGQEADDLMAYEGLFWRRPVLAAVLTAAALSLAGIPLTVGFIAKFYVFAAGAEGTLWVLVWALVIGSAIGIYYYLRIVFTMIRKPGEEPADDGIEEPAPPAGGPEATIPRLTAAVTIVLGLAILAFGIYPTPIIDFVTGLTGP